MARLNWRCHVRRRRERRNVLPRLLGDLESTGVVTLTPDTTPELHFSFPGAAPASISITDGTTAYGPYTVTNGVAQVSPEIPPGTYEVTTTAEDKKGNLVPIVGTVTIQNPSFDWSHASEMALDFTATNFDWSLVNG